MLPPPRRVILACGDRNWRDATLVHVVLDALLAESGQAMTLIEGGARGADQIAGAWANRLGIEHVTIRADWARYGKGAGPIRNTAMLDHRPDLVVAFHDDLLNSHGTKDCVTQAKARGIEVRLVSHLTPHGRTLNDV